MLRVTGCSKHLDLIRIASLSNGFSLSLLLSLQVQGYGKKMCLPIQMLLPLDGVIKSRWSSTGSPKLPVLGKYRIFL